MGLGNMGKMMKQVQKLQAEMERVQEELAGARVEASAGGGVVRAVANGHGELLALTIDPAAVDPADVALLQDLVVAAVTEAQRNARALAEARMKAVTGDLGLPGRLR
ncbi:MAG: YbaB/EbfC family nucleoid-associated protein [Armatimonadota bacterium]|nr:YbaB/EbfC family nucleoid-associated protein [Armatimonadota bacterium]MDR7531800.1 YbaB/EbfC family nucleoid-associated protein [Armatimonadota bacterium]MDR7534855.1 YbaB/EbfC family nucleoid-associated protein [Armatimonadota bacterium]